MIIFGPLWLVAIVWFFYWLANRPPKRWHCKGCRQPVPRFTPVCPNCRATLTWENDAAPKPSRHIFLKVVLWSIAIPVFGIATLVIIGAVLGPAK